MANSGADAVLCRGEGNSLQRAVKAVPCKKCGDVDEKLQFLKIQDLRPLNTC